MPKYEEDPMSSFRVIRKAAQLIDSNFAPGTHAVENQRTRGATGGGRPET